MKEFDKLINTVRILRSPGGCPWDRAQKLSDARKHLIEETYELIEGIDEKKYDLIKEELGDLFLVLVFITDMLSEKGLFDLKEVLKIINDKLISRHPHVFAGKKLKDKDEVLKYWIAKKAKKKKRKTIKDRLPKDAPSLFLAEMFLKEASYLNSKGKKNNKKKINALIASINDDLSSFSGAKAKHLENIIFSLCQLSYICKVDLESILRRKILKTAEKTPYNP